MRKIISAFIGIVFIGGAFASAVSDRTDCAGTKSRIDALVAQGDLNDSESALLTDLRALYRNNCMARAAGRGARTIAAKRVGVKESAAMDKVSETEVSATEETVIAEPCATPDANGCCPDEEFADYGIAGKYCCKDDFCFPPMDVKPEKTEEEIAAEIAANIEKGLCGDGTKPNKFGCCTGEIFKDLGNAEFACCKKDGDECYPPMK